MNKVKQMKKEIEIQRSILEEKIKNSDNLLNPDIIIQSQKLDLILNKYIKTMQ